VQEDVAGREAITGKVGRGPGDRVEPAWKRRFRGAEAFGDEPVGPATQRVPYRWMSEAGGGAERIGGRGVVAVLGQERQRLGVDPADRVGQTTRETDRDDTARRAHTQMAGQQPDEFGQFRRVLVEDPVGLVGLMVVLGHGRQETREMVHGDDGEERTRAADQCGQPSRPEFLR
jgi:hypothetical protein